MDLMSIGKEQALDNLTWIGGRFKGYSDADVSISRVHWNKRINPNIMAYSFVFRNEATKMSERVQVSIYKNRVLFRPSNEGIRLNNSSSEKNKNKYFKINRSFIPDLGKDI